MLVENVRSISNMEYYLNPMLREVTKQFNHNRPTRCWVEMFNHLPGALSESQPSSYAFPSLLKCSDNTMTS